MISHINSIIFKYLKVLISKNRTWKMHIPTTVTNFKIRFIRVHEQYSFEITMFSLKIQGKKWAFKSHKCQHNSSVFFELKGSREKRFWYTIPKSYGFQTLLLRLTSLSRERYKVLIYGKMVLLKQDTNKAISKLSVLIHVKRFCFFINACNTARYQLLRTQNWHYPYQWRRKLTL